MAGNGVSRSVSYTHLDVYKRQVHALDDAFLVAGGQARLRVVFVHHRQVVVDVFLVFHHALEAMLDDHGQFVAEGRVVRDAVGDGRGQDVAVAVFVLQAFAVERRCV